MLASIIITNYNYGQFLAEAIESALAQTYPQVEVIVIDDGSTDHSAAIIASYATRISPVFKSNGGQCSCVNLALQHGRGEVILFLDADDVLLEHTVARHVEGLRKPGVIKSCGYLAVTDVDGKVTGATIPEKLQASGDYRERILQQGLAARPASFTSGNAWTRDFLEQVLPLPENDIIGADGYLTAIDGLFGRIESIHEPVALYRLHGSNKGPRKACFDASYMKNRVQRWHHRAQYATRWAEQLGYPVNPQAFQRIRDWRLALMSYTLSELGEQAASPSFGELVFAPFNNRKGRLVKSTLTSIALVAIRVLPRRPAMHLSRYLLVGRRHQPTKTTRSRGKPFDEQQDQ